MVAVSRDLTRQGCNAIPNYRTRVIYRAPQFISEKKFKIKPINSLEVITKDVSVKHSGTGEFPFVLFN